ncbi:unnamed protein product [Nyctereutes procyonoides]|uniref:(raccoon dog) hypothetical protein n=1 Tax=Nyctereutes procyonoides TaxID=34880 RepID=A0A811Y8H7_NYCPR|nr:unnamed protein product [Nyctereutes procyonoides]
MIPEFQDRVSHQGPCRGACFSLCLCLYLSLSTLPCNTPLFLLIKLGFGIPGWCSGLAPAFGPGPNPGDPGSNPTSALKLHDAFKKKKKDFIYLRERKRDQEQGGGWRQREEQTPLSREPGAGPIPGPRDHDLSRRLGHRGSPCMRDFCVPINWHQMPFFFFKCLNESDEHGFDNCLLKDTTFLESDCDEQLLMTVAFNQPVKLYSMKFQDLPRSMDFEEAERSEPTQALELTEDDIKEDGIVLLSNQGEETTRISYFTFIGTPVQATNMNDFKRRGNRDIGRGRSRLHVGSLMWDSIPKLRDDTLGGRQTLNC